MNNINYEAIKNWDNKTCSHQKNILTHLTVSY